MLPSLICGLWISYTDLRYRLVSRFAIVMGLILQTVCYLWLCVSGNAPCSLIDRNPCTLLQAPCVRMVLMCALVAIANALLQLFLAMIHPGALGFGDVSASMLVGYALGRFGWFAWGGWWLMSCTIGLCSLGLMCAAGRLRRRFFNNGWRHSENDRDDHRYRTQQIITLDRTSRMMHHDQSIRPTGHARPCLMLKPAQASRMADHSQSIQSRAHCPTSKPHINHMHEPTVAFAAVMYLAFVIVVAKVAA